MEITAGVSKKMLFLIILISLAAKLCVIISCGSASPATWEYDQAAESILSGKGVLVENYRFNTDYKAAVSPVYPFILALVYRFFPGNHFAALLLQAIIASLLPLVIFAIAESAYADKKVSLLAALLSAFHPGINYYGIRNIHDLPLYSLLFALCLLCLIKLKAQPSSIKNIFFSAAVFALSILIRPASLAFIIFGLFWAGYYTKIDIYARLRAAALIAFLTTLLLLPWFIRNYVVFKKAVFFQTIGGEAFWQGNSRQSCGALYSKEGRLVISQIPGPLKKDLEAAGEEGQCRLFYADAFKHIKAVPGLFLKNLARKFYYFWWFHPFSGLTYPAGFTFLYKVYYTLILFFCLAGISRPGLNNPVAVLLLFFLILSSLPDVLYYACARHRFALEPLMLVFASKGASGLYGYFKRGR